jgi:hypothetical protein
MPLFLLVLQTRDDLENYPWQGSRDLGKRALNTVTLSPEGKELGSGK